MFEAVSWRRVAHAALWVAFVVLAWVTLALLAGSGTAHADDGEPRSPASAAPVVADARGTPAAIVDDLTRPPDALASDVEDREDHVSESLVCLAGAREAIEDAVPATDDGIPSLPVQVAHDEGAESVTPDDARASRSPPTQATPTPPSNPP